MLLVLLLDKTGIPTIPAPEASDSGRKRARKD
jgi:hypothetical protein